MTATGICYACGRRDAQPVAVVDSPSGPGHLIEACPDHNSKSPLPRISLASDRSKSKCSPSSEQHADGSGEGASPHPTN